jgi:murein DD-endopeptidase MepM/ murein hydrolase activator NlpD
MSRAAPWVLLFALLGAAMPSQAKKVYKIVDEKGVTHYTDRKPDSMVNAKVIQVRAERQRIAHLRLEGNDGERRAVVSNRLAGAIEVELRYTARDNIAADPDLPLRIVIPAESERSVAVLRAVDAQAAASFALEFTAVPGPPDASPDGSVYALPLDSSVWRIDQGFGGSFSHTDEQSRYAIDLAADEGTPVLAAREGQVMQVEDDFEGAGLDREKFASRANHIRVLHADGTMAVYAHLQPESVMVSPGQRVRRGQRLGASGNTGFSTGPHLHFVVQVNRDMNLVSIPFELEGPAGSIAIPDAATR